MAPDAGTGSSSDPQEGTLPPAWQQTAAAFAGTAAGLCTPQDPLLWQSPSLPLLLSPQGSTGGGGGLDAAVHAALGLLGWGADAHSPGGLAAAAALGPAAAYQLLGFHGNHLVFRWQPQEAAQHLPALWSLQGGGQLPAGGVPVPHQAPLGALAWQPQDAARLCQPSFGFLAQQPVAAAAAAAAAEQAQLALAQAQQAQHPPQHLPQHFSFQLPDGTAALAGRAFTPAPLAQPPPVADRQPALHRTSSMPAAADLPPQPQPRSVEVVAATAAATVALPRSISFPPPSQLAQRSPFAEAAHVPLVAARGASSAPAATPVPSPPVPDGQQQAVAAEPPTPLAGPAWLSQGRCAHFNLPDFSAPLNEDILSLYLSWNQDGPASLHL